jgi:hypothetical protein
MIGVGIKSDAHCLAAKKYPYQPTSGYFRAIETCLTAIAELCFYFIPIKHTPPDYGLTSLLCGMRRIDKAKDD